MKYVLEHYTFEAKEVFCLVATGPFSLVAVELTQEEYICALLTIQEPAPYRFINSGHTSLCDWLEVSTN